SDQGGKAGLREVAERESGRHGDQEGEDEQLFLPVFPVSKKAERVLDEDEREKHERENESDRIPAESPLEKVEGRVDDHHGVEEVQRRGDEIAVEERAMSEDGAQGGPQADMFLRGFIIVPEDEQHVEEE